MLWVRSCFLAAAIVALGAIRSRTATAEQPRVVYALQYRTQEGCPNESAFVAEIAARTARAVRKSPGPRTTLADVELRFEGDIASGTVTFRQPEGSNYSRSVRAPTCAEVAAALALVVALTLDPEASIPPVASPPPTAPSAPVPPPPAFTIPSAPLPSAPSDAFAKPPTPRPRPFHGRINNKGRPRDGADPQLDPSESNQGSQRGSSGLNHEPTSDDQTPAAPLAPPTLSTPLPSAVPLPARLSKQQDAAPPGKSSRSNSAWALSADVAVAAQVAVAPWWMAGGVLHAAALHRSGWGTGVSLTVFPMREGTKDGVGAAFGLWTMRSEGCYLVLARKVLQALACVAFEAGRLTATGDPGGPIAIGVSGAGAWLAGVGIGRIAMPWGPLTFEGQGELLVPLVRDQFGIRTGGSEFTTTHRPSPLAVGVRLGLGYHFSK